MMLDNKQISNLVYTASYRVKEMELMKNVNEKDYEEGRNLTFLSSDFEMKRRMFQEEYRVLIKEIGKIAEDYENQFERSI